MTPAEQYTEELTKRVRAYMADGAEFDPLAASNICEAMGHVDKCDEIAANMARLIREGRAAEVGAYLLAESINYWTPLATRQAEIDMATEADENDERPVLRKELFGVLSVAA